MTTNSPATNDLSDRELEVLELIAEDMANKQIARALHITEKTVKSHVEVMLKKTGARSRVGLAMLHARSVGSFGASSFRAIGG